MRIIIVGFGKVGSVLAWQLCAEKHDVTVIDCDESLASYADNTDIVFYTGNGVKLDDLQNAGCENADLIIAVTGVDEVNMLVCCIAKLLGVKETIARVRNPEYSSQIGRIKDRLGIDMTINPELAATGEILRLLRFPSAMTVDTFAKGIVEIVSVRLKDESRLDGMPLYELQKNFPANVLVCAVERAGKIHIPNGSFVLQAQDRISVVAERGEIEKFFKATGAFQKRKIKRVMIVGASRIGYYLTAEIAKYGMSVTVIDTNREKLNAIADNLSGSITIVEGDGSSSDLLQEYDITGHDAFVALTGLDEENMVLAMYAARQNLGKIIAKVNRQTFLGMVKNTDVETYVSPKLICTNQILQYVRARVNSKGSNVATLHTIVDDKVEAVEFIVNPTSKSKGIPLKDLQIKDNMLVACITRAGTVITPSGKDTIETGDHVIIVTTSKGLNDLDDILK